MRLKADRKKIAFDYEFCDGTVAKMEYLEPTTAMIDESTQIDTKDTTAQLSHVKEILRTCLRGDEDAKDKLMDEQINEGNIYAFKSTLDEELGKLRKRK